MDGVTELLVEEREEEDGTLLGAEELERDETTLDELIPAQFPPAVQACCQ